MQPSGRIKFTVDTDGSRRVDQATKYIVGYDYFQTIGIGIVRGRGFAKDDEKGRSHSVIVSEALARTVWRNEDPIGRRLSLVSKNEVTFGLMGGSAFDYRTASRDESYEVVGVATDVLETPVEQPGPAVYLPMTGEEYAKPTFQGITLATRTTPGLDAASIVRAQIAAIDPKLTTFNVKTMPDWIEQLMFIVKIGLCSDLRIAAGAVVILVLVGLSACYLPARRSGRVESVVALRQE